MDAHAQAGRRSHQAVDSHQGDDIILGIGTGSTAECFIAELPRLRDRIKTTVSSSERSSALLLELGFEVQDLNAVDRVDVYVDGADESTQDGFLIKGGVPLSHARRSPRQKQRIYLHCRQQQNGNDLRQVPLPVEVIHGAHLGPRCT